MNDFSFTFSTKKLDLHHSYPTPRMQFPTLNPVFFLVFNQKVDPVEIFKKVSITSNCDKNGGELILISEKEAKENDSIKNIPSFPEHSLAFKLSSPLAPETSYKLIISPGVPSLEGPLLTTSEISLEFKTYPPFTITRYQPNTATQKVSPRVDWIIYFSNPIDLNRENRDVIQINPPCKDSKISFNSSHIVIQSKSEHNTDYEVKILGDLKDIFGQNLIGNNTLIFRIRAKIPRGKNQKFKEHNSIQKLK